MGSRLRPARGLRDGKRLGQINTRTDSSGILGGDSSTEMKAPVEIVLAFPTRLTAYALSDGDSASSWIQVAVVGEYESSAYGKFSITSDDLRQMLSNFSSGKFPEPPTEICLDYDHLSLKPKNPGDGKAAGWFKELQLRANDSELWARVEWTPGGAEAVKAGEYRYVSPTFSKTFKNNAGESIGCTLINAAITNHPFLQGMAPMELSMRTGRVALAVLGDSDRRFRVDEAVCRAFNEPFSDPWNCYLVEIFGDVAVFYRDSRYYSVTFSLADDGTVTFEGTPVEVVVQYAPIGAGASLMANSKTLLSLRAADGKDVQVDLALLEELPFVKELRAKLPKEGETVVTAAALEALTGKVTTLTTQMTALSTRADTAEAQVKATELQLHTDRANAKVSALIAAGKLTPAQKEWAQKYALTSPVDFDAFAGTLAVVVQLNRSAGSGQAGDAGTAEAQLEAKAKEIQASQSGLSFAEAYSLASDRNPELFRQAMGEHDARVVSR